jgi:predicted acylesterase/phospholipase RssA/CRP-like cAMP-binding protein
MGDVVRSGEAVLGGSEVFGSLDEAVRDRLAHAMGRRVVPAGQALLRQGELGEALFIVVRGRFEVRLSRGGEPESVIDTVGPGDTVGEMQLVVGGVASASVVAADEAEVLGLPRADFDALCGEMPELLEAVARVARRRVQRQQMLEVLPSVLGPLDDDLLAAIEREARWVSLPCGEVLFRQGDPGDAWYVVTSGRVAVVEPSPDEQSDRLLAEVGRGEALGELALLTAESRSATVYALRDAELVRFPVSEFAALLATVPQVRDSVLRSLAGRLLRHTGAPRATASSGLSLALVPATPDVDIAAFAERLAAALSRFGSTRAMSSAALDGIGIRRDLVLRHESHPAWLRVGAWLEAQSAWHRFLLLVADATPNGWTTTAVGHADQVLVVADAAGDPRPGPLELTLRPPPAPRRRLQRRLALLHRDGSTPPSGTSRWLDAREDDEHTHVRLDRQDDIDRLARSIAGRGVSLVLSGGGARCFAQLGVVCAMRERSIPIDLVAGTSAGAMSAFLVAADRTDAEMREAARLFHRARPMRGFTLPLFSLKRGERLSRALRAQCGDTRIEDLWLPFVAVSSNLTRSSVELHTRGPAWEALRASGAAPGIVDPYVRDGELLVDGALTDNLPVRVARERLAGQVIAVDVSAAQPLRLVEGTYPSPWREVLGRLAHAGARRHRPPPPGLPDIMLHSMFLASLATVEQMRLEADLCLRPELAEVGMHSSAMHERIIDAGYHHALDRLTSFSPADDGEW